jgi:hypothetical protein
LLHSLRSPVSNPALKMILAEEAMENRLIQSFESRGFLNIFRILECEAFTLPRI